MAEDLAKTSKKSTKIPLVSVVMSVYNGEKYLREAIDSILNQTFTDFEFIIINDGSTDNTLKIIKGYKDPRIVLISRKNKGLVASLNEGIEKAQGKYIARMDADDISHKERLEFEVKKIESTKSGLVGTAFYMINQQGNIVGLQPIATHNSELQLIIRVANPFAHGGVLFSRDLFYKSGPYSEYVGPAEDYDLWLKMAPHTSLSGINRELYCWRVNPEGISHQKSADQISSALQLQQKYNSSNSCLSVPIYQLVTSYYSNLFSLKNVNRALSRQTAAQVWKSRSLVKSSKDKTVIYCCAFLTFPWLVGCVYKKVMSKISYLIKKYGTQRWVRKK